MYDQPKIDKWRDARLQGWAVPDVQACESVSGFGHALILLQTMLPIAVATEIERVRHESWDERIARLDAIRAQWAAEGRNCWSEALLYRTKEQVVKGVPVSGTKAEFVRLATFLAVASFCPGGVRAFGLHWESHEAQADAER